MAKGWLFGSDSSARRRVQPLAKPQDIAQQWPLVNPARLRTPIEIFAPSPSTDVSGATVSFALFASGWAEVKALRGTDAWKAGQFTSQKYMQVTTRFIPGILAKMRITFTDQNRNTRTLQVEDVIDVYERGIVLEILCIELDGQ